MPQDCLEQSRPPLPCGLAMQGAIADDCTDAGGRAMQGAIAEKGEFYLLFFNCNGLV